MRVVANFTDEDGNFTNGEGYELTENGCLDNRGFNFKYYLNASGNNLLEKWNKEWRGHDFEGIFTEVKDDTMKKSYLKTGLHAVELRDGSFYIVVGDHFLSDSDWIPLKRYDENLERITTKQSKYNIFKIYKHKQNFEYGLGYGFQGLIKKDYELIWERETEQQKQIKELKKIIQDAANKIREIEGE